VFNANDLLNVNVYFEMINSLIVEFENTLILDCETNFKTLNQKEQNKISKFNNPLEWYKIKNSTNRNSFSKNKTEYNRLTNKIPNNLKKQLEQIVFNKLQLLKAGAISQPKNKIKKGAISQVYIRGICTQNQTQTTKVENLLCKVTGFNISMQKDNSILLSHTGLKYYYKTDRKVFEQIKRKYLSKQWTNSDFETQIKEIAHNIRNAKCNLKIKQNRMYKTLQINMLSMLKI
jgi:hypothetical protein